LAEFIAVGLIPYLLVGWMFTELSVFEGFASSMIEYRVGLLWALLAVVNG
jgi:hypothetical protein